MLPASTRLGPYEIIAPLGAGGMGQVYRARDSRLDRDVALKVLPREFAGDPDRLSRFEREVKAVAALSHPNILVLHDFGTHDGLPYAVTELLEGATLRERLRSEALAWRAAVRIALAMAEGLAEAHSKRIIHRDLKPENVFLTKDDRVKILDFGLAKLGALPAAESMATRLYGPSPTKTGMILGTAPYMSPEQLCGQDVDVRSDLFALGIVLYEMLTGRQPFTGNTAAELMGAILHKDPPEFGDSGRQIPASLQQLVRRCLDKDRNQRPQSAQDVATALRSLMTDGIGPVVPNEPRQGLWRVVVAGAGVVLMLIVAIVFFPRPHANTEPTASPAIQSIAILPIINRSDDPRADVLSDGVPRTMIRSFLEIPDVNVRPFSSVAHYAAQEPIDPREVGQQLDVEAVLAGTMTGDDEALVMTVELMDVPNNRLLWLQSYDVQQDMLFIQDDILQEVAAKLGWRLTAPQLERLSRRPTRDTEAYLEYLEGIHAVHQWTVADTKRGIDRLERALARDPDFALAYAALADAYIAAAYIFMEPGVAFEKAREAGTEALKRDADLAEAHAAIATVMFHVDWDWTGADLEFREALRLNPRCTFAYDYYGWYWVARGRPAEAIAALEKAVELEPRSMLYNPDLAFVYQHGREFDAAERQARRTLELDANNAMAPWALSMVYSHRDRDFAAAQREAELFLQRDTNRPDGFGMLGWVYGMSGQREKALEVLAGLRELSQHAYIRGEVWAWIYTGLGDKDQAFHWLNKVCDERSPGVIYFKLDPLLDTLRDDPRFDELLRRVGLAE